LKEGEILEGKVVEELRYGGEHRLKGEISGVNVQVRKGDFVFIGFIPFSKLKRVDGSREIPKIGQEIKVKVIRIPDLTNSDLILSQEDIEEEGRFEANRHNS
jgi:predicted RNA-binding protein with RPS1 domain